MHEAYRPPEAQLEDPPARPRSSVAAVLLGGLVVDFLGSMVAIVVMTMAMGIFAATSGAVDEERIAAMLDSTAFLITGSILGGAMAFAGGHVAARWARRRPVAHGVGAGLLSLGVSLPLFALPGALEPLWLTVAGLVLHLPLAGLGGYTAGRRMA